MSPRIVGASASGKISAFLLNFIGTIQQFEIVEFASDGSVESPLLGGEGERHTIFRPERCPCSHPSFRQHTLNTVLETGGWKPP